MSNLVLTNNTWKRFVQEDVLDTSRISKRIAESWFRCKEYNVNPYLDKGRTILRVKEYEKKVADHQMLLEISMPYLQSIWRSINQSRSIVILTDAEGFVLKLIGEGDFSRSINLLHGVKWSENEVGTNAIGTALAIQEPIHVIGREHFSIASHNWSCSAAPIKNYRGEVIGVVDISNFDSMHDLKLLSLSVSIAYAIESEWKLQEQMRRIALIEHFMVQKKNKEDNIIISDPDGYFVSASDAIMKIVKEDSDLYSSHVKKLQDIGIEFIKKQPIYSSVQRLLGYRHDVKYVNDSIKEYFVTTTSTFNFVGEQGISIEFNKVIKDMELASKSDITVSIYGESGTGKEVVAKSIHLNSDRKHKPFVAVNCGSIPKELLESELFGYVEGAFTGARKKGYEGKFVQANGGTIFLDEIGEMPFSMQVALLRVIQEKEVMPIGGSLPIAIDIRIITATNKDLGKLVRQGRIFREDLYYRLHVFDLKLPPLRKRKKDIPYLINYFLRSKNLDIKIPQTVVDCLTEYIWPGNIRELFNVLEKMVVLSDRQPLKLTHVPHYIRENQKFNSSVQEQEAAYQQGQFLNKVAVQRDKMLKALQKTSGNVREAADLIGMPHSTFYRKMKQFNI